MRDELLTYAAQRRVDDSLRQRLERLDAQSQEALVELIALGPSANTLRDLLRLSQEICARDGLALPALYSKEQFQQIFQKEACSRKEKQKLIRQELDGLRYPELRKIRNRLAECRGNLRRDCGVAVDLPQDLEGDALKISFNVRSVEELREAAQRIEAAARHESTEEIFRVLRGEL